MVIYSTAGYCRDNWSHPKDGKLTINCAAPLVSKQWGKVNGHWRMHEAVCVRKEGATQRR